MSVLYTLQMEKARLALDSKTIKHAAVSIVKLCLAEGTC